MIRDVLYTEEAEDFPSRNYLHTQGITIIMNIHNITIR